MKLDVEQPSRLIDINGLPLDKVEATPAGGVRIGAMVRNTEFAYHPLILKNYPALSQAILSGASPQLRNMATTGGNLLQRTRCTYFRDPSYACNKREPGSGCAALHGYNRMRAILGTSEQCIATHPSDMCVAMAALDATIHVTGSAGERAVPFGDFYVPYGQDPAKETTLNPGELITSVELPAVPFFGRSLYLEVRDRAEYEFAISSAAVAVEVQDGILRQARVALGGVGTKPWRAFAVEKALTGQKATAEVFLAAAEAEFKPAVPREFNAFKIELSKRTVVRALEMAVALT